MKNFPNLRILLNYKGTYVANFTDTIKARQSEDFSPKNLFIEILR